LKFKYDKYFEISRAIGFYRHEERTVYIHPSWNSRSDIKQLTDLIKHELVHAWVHWKGLYTGFANGHNEAFLRKCMELDVDVLHLRHTYPETIGIIEKLQEEMKKIKLAVIPKPVVPPKPSVKPVYKSPV